MASLDEWLAAMGANRAVPPAALRARVLGGLAPLRFSFARAHEGLWLAHGRDGAQARMLLADSRDRWTTLLVRLPAGGTLPAPSLGGARHLLVLAGTLEAGGEWFARGEMVDEAASGAATWRAVEPAEVLVQERAATEGIAGRAQLESVGWTTLVPGIRVVVRPAAGVTLVDAEAGAVLPAHVHEGIEELFVVAGSCTVEGEVLHQGDYHRAAEGSRHGDTIAGADGCLLYASLRRAAA